MTLKNKSIYSLYSIMKVGFQGLILESMILQSLGKPKFHNQICFKISKSVPYFVGFRTMQIWDLQTMLYHPPKVLSVSFTLSLDFSSVHCVVSWHSLLCIIVPLTSTHQFTDPQYVVQIRSVQYSRRRAILKFRTTFFVI